MPGNCDLHTNQLVPLSGSRSRHYRTANRRPSSSDRRSSTWCSAGSHFRLQPTGQRQSTRQRLRRMVALRVATAVPEPSRALAPCRPRPARVRHLLERRGQPHRRTHGDVCTRPGPRMRYSTKNAHPASGSAPHVRRGLRPQPHRSRSEASGAGVGRSPANRRYGAVDGHTTRPMARCLRALPGTTTHERALRAQWPLAVGDHPLSMPRAASVRPTRPYKRAGFECATTCRNAPAGIRGKYAISGCLCRWNACDRIPDGTSRRVDSSLAKATQDHLCLQPRPQTDPGGGPGA